LAKIPKKHMVLGKHSQGLYYYTPTENQLEPSIIRPEAVERNNHFPSIGTVTDILGCNTT
jgi:hypothetical protein